MAVRLGENGWMVTLEKFLIDHSDEVPELLDEVKRSRLDMEPITGEEIEATYKELMDQPKAVVDLVKKLEEN